MKLPYFGEIDTNNVEECYEAELSYKGWTVELDLNFDESKLSEGDAAYLVKMLDKLPSHIELARKAVEKDWHAGEASETARFYVDMHSDIADELFTGSSTVVSELTYPEIAQALVVTRVGIYPEEEDVYLICDIQFSTEFTNYLMAVSITRDGKFGDIALES